MVICKPILLRLTGSDEVGGAADRTRTRWAVPGRSSSAIIWYASIVAYSVKPVGPTQPRS